MSPTTEVTHMATLRVERITPASNCVAWARNRFNAAAAIAAYMSPSTMAAVSVSKACRLAYDFHAFNRNSTGHRHV